MASIINAVKDLSTPKWRGAKFRQKFEHDYIIKLVRFEPENNGYWLCVDEIQSIRYSLTTVHNHRCTWFNVYIFLLKLMLKVNLFILIN